LVFARDGADISRATVNRQRRGGSYQNETIANNSIAYSWMSSPLAAAAGQAIRSAASR